MNKFTAITLLFGLYKAETETIDGKIKVKTPSGLLEEHVILENVQVSSIKPSNLTINVEGKQVTLSKENYFELLKEQGILNDFMNDPTIISLLLNGDKDILTAGSEAVINAIRPYISVDDAKLAREYIQYVFEQISSEISPISQNEEESSVNENNDIEGLERGN
ncbi:hypothetical protein GINT2_000830 [Glugoides intestinalis]